MLTIIKNLKLGALSLALSLVPIGLYAQPASAHYVYQKGTIYQSYEDCVDGYSEISHGIGYGYSKSDVIANIYNPIYGPCATHFTRPIGALTVHQYFMVHLAPGWGICHETGNLSNAREDWNFSVSRTWSNFCGYYYYYGTYSSLYEYNYGWHGGDIWSGEHQLY